MDQKYFAVVAKVIDDYKIVINKGSTSGVKENALYNVIELGDDIIDPDTKEVLEKLEIVKGIVKPIHIQENITTLVSCKYQTAPDRKEIKITSVSPLMKKWGFMSHDDKTETITPGEKKLMKLDDVKVGDYLALIR